MLAPPYERGDNSMSESRSQQSDLANLAAAIERAAADLSVAEEPSRFVLALEESAEEESA